MKSSLVDYSDSMSFEHRIAAASTQLTASEKLVAEAILVDRKRVAFGTVADTAALAGVGAATVLRLAGKLGFDGFSSLQVEVQRELAAALEPASLRVRNLHLGEAVAEQSDLDVQNVLDTLRGLNSEALERIAKRLANVNSRVIVLSGESAAGIALEFMNRLYSLRDEVWLLDGNDVTIGRNLARLRDSDELVIFALRPYDRWVVKAVERAKAVGVSTVIITDSAVSPVVPYADELIVALTQSKGPFESNVGVLALSNLLLTSVAAHASEIASQRLGQAEGAWREMDSFIVS